nr:MAG TPA: hypothetical protein [Caudoviricetes sp.]
MCCKKRKWSGSLAECFGGFHSRTGIMNRRINKNDQSETANFY